MEPHTFGQAVAVVVRNKHLHLVEMVELVAAVVVPHIHSHQEQDWAVDQHSTLVAMHLATLRHQCWE
jgi:hypothetical protein